MAVAAFTLSGALSGSSSQASTRRRAAVEVENPLFAYTHLLPSPFTLPAGRLVLGTELVFGVTDFLQIGTNLVRNFYQNYNAQLKASLVDSPEFALALTGGLEYFNPRSLSGLNPDVWIRSYLPGLVAGFELLPRVGIFVGGNLNFSQTDVPSDELNRSGFFRGALLQSEINWAYNPPVKKRGVGLGNVVAAGMSYDLTYRLLGLGLSHHWPGFRLGVHYYPGAENFRWLPLINGGAVVYF